ncbi:MAG: 23S rRNA (adenine(2503)-C(2))-methyltransferase RlmN [Pirellulaceae bacterium]
MTYLLDPSSHRLSQWLQEQGEPAFRSRQIWRWLAIGRATCFAEMTDLPASLREKLDDLIPVWETTVLAHQQSEDGSEKLLLEFSSGGQAECVLLRDGDRRTVCISSQVGCAMGCVFCASGLGGVDRDLATGEIIEQMIRLQHCLPEEERISHIVMMGMGEPLANLDNVLSALEFSGDPEGLGISARRITISTVGLPAAIRKMAARECRYHLAVSLHAAEDSLRTRLVPVNQGIGLEDILSAADSYFDVSGRRLTFEYVLLAGVNDSPGDASRLGALLRGRPAMINLIPCNPVDGLPYQPPSSAAVRRFQQVLEDLGLNVQIRQRKGDKINAACGQLRRTVGGAR